MDIQVGDKLKMKKKHPCGSTEWDVLRVGIDFRLKCCGCGHMVLLERRQEIPEKEMKIEKLMKCTITIGVEVSQTGEIRRKSRRS